MHDKLKVKYMKRNQLLNMSSHSSLTDETVGISRL